MFEYYNNKLCVQAGWLYGDGEIMTIYNYKNLTNRKWLNILRRGCKGTPALVEFDSIPPRFKDVIIDKCGDPHKTTKHHRFKDYLKNDLDAVKFFSDFTLESGESLPQKNIQEYVANAIVLNAIGEIVNETKRIRRTLGGSTSKIWNAMADIIQDLPKHTYPHTLPSNVRRLKEKYSKYKKNGYYSLIHGGFCNKNSEKINDQAKSWLFARWADRVNRVATTHQLFNEYNAIAPEKNWKPLLEERTIYNYLHQPEVECLWYGHRYGELKAKEKYGYQHSTKLPSLRDSLWYSDGTKMNFYYQENGKVKTCQVYEVMDAFSEVFLGYHISESENYEAQYHAFKMAASVSEHRPYEMRFDNQGGHKKLEAGDLFSRLARLSIRTEPYNGKSKTIESAFGRFQSQYLKQYWFFTGMNIQTKRNESKANLEFIMANKADLPTLNEVKEIYKKCRQEWNSAPHYATKQPRIEMYLNSVNPDAPKIELWDMVDLFWIKRPKPITLTAYGLSFKEKKVQYTYMKYDADGMPDIEWLRSNIDKKFVVKFDPEDMTMIHLYEDTPLGLRHVTMMTTKVEIHRGIQEQEEWEASYIKQISAKNKEIRVKTVETIEAILEEHGATAEQYGLKSPKIKGVNSKRKKQAKPNASNDDFGKVQKSISNQTEVESQGEDFYSLT